MLYKARIAVCSEISYKTLNAERARVEFLNVKLGGT
jgi:hypothetical protein